MLRKLVSVAACALAFTVAAPAAAQAASRTFADGPGDVWTTEPQPSRVANRDQGDILRTTLSHRPHRVVVRTAFAELNREGRILVYTRLRTNTGKVFVVSQIARSNHYQGRAVVAGGGGRRVDCAVGNTFDYATNVATVSVPRSCLGNPRTLQARFGVATGTARRGFADNPMNHRATNQLPPYTAPVRVG